MSTTTGGVEEASGLGPGKAAKVSGAEVVRQRLLVVVVVLVGKLSIASPLALAELPEAAFLATP